MKIIQQAFETDWVLLDVEAHSLPQVFDRTVDLLVERGVVQEDQKEEVTRALLDRESTASTAIGHAVAVPHAYLDAVSEPTVVFVRLDGPLNLGAPDGIPTRYLFFLLGPSEASAQHLDTLTNAARLMSDEEFRYEARQASNSSDLLVALDHVQQVKSRPHARKDRPKACASPVSSWGAFARISSGEYRTT